jgi:ATP adenylyltransferase
MKKTRPASMEKLWAPWRKAYITMKKETGCIFCAAGKKRKGVSDAKRYVLKRTRYAFSMLNRYPYNNAHVMVAPYRHAASLEYLTHDELLDLLHLLNDTKKKIDTLLEPNGFNIGINLGTVAGAGFPGHVHIHIVPRWKGDTNFMPVLSQTKVVSYALDDMYRTLKG